MERWTQLCVLLLAPAVVDSCPDHCQACAGPGDQRCEQCRPGWMLHNNVCVDVDECGTEQDQCPHNTFCLNKDGSYECKGCDPSCLGCMGGGPARCKKCAPGYRLTGAKCSDIDECSEKVLACHGLGEICTNIAGSFSCDCADGFVRKDGVCVRDQIPGSEEKGLFEDMKEEEVEVLMQMFFGVVLCALATLAAKGDLVYTSLFMGGVAAMAGYWLSDKADRFLDNILKRR